MGAARSAQADPASSTKTAANAVLQQVIGVMEVVFIELIFVGGDSRR
jgi:hypothetical protein